jgi:GntR family transcriptional regulator
MMTAHQSQPLPKYYLIRSILRARLEREGLEGQRLPSEIDLGREFGVSRVTVQQALALLEKEGLIRREQGRGTFYLGEQPRAEAKLSGILDSLVKYRDGGYARVVAKKLVRATPRLAAKLKLAPGAPVVAIDRVGVLDGHPVLYTTAFVPQSIGASLLDDGEDLALTRQTVGSILQDKYGVDVASVQQTIAAALADPAFAAHLGVEIGEAVLEVERVYVDRAGTPANFSVTFYRTDRYRFEIAMT